MTTPNYFPSGAFMYRSCLYLSALVLFSSCVKTENPVDPLPNGECLLNSFVSEFPEPSMFFGKYVGASYEYDSRNLPVKAHLIDNNTGKPEPGTYMEISYNGTTPSQTRRYEKNLIIATENYSFEGDLLRRVHTQYHGNTPKINIDSETQTYYYDSAKRLIAKSSVTADDIYTSTDSIAYSEFSGTRPGIEEHFSDSNGGMLSRKKNKYEYQNGNRIAEYRWNENKDTWELTRKTYFDLSKPSIESFIQPQGSFGLKPAEETDRNLLVRAEYYTMNCNGVESSTPVMNGMSEYSFSFNGKNKPVSGTETGTRFCSSPGQYTVKYSFEYLNCK